MRIVLVDNDSLVLEALKTILESAGHQVTGAYVKSNLPLAEYFRDSPDLFLLDIQMPEKSGLELARELMHADSEVKILLLTTFEDEKYIAEALKLGCKGYLLKQNFNGIIPAIEAVASGHLIFNEKIMDQVNRIALRFEDQRLSERELKLTRLVAEGLNNKEIAAELFLSEGTVRNLLSEVLAKLDLRDRTQLAVYYYKKLISGN
ncbi:MAG: response regulator transcription factor [Eubacteriales bacterium]|nr:response regulator transcription factor [Eubacteriales bacterium]